MYINPFWGEKLRLVSFKKSFHIGLTQYLLSQKYFSKKTILHAEILDVFKWLDIAHTFMNARILLMLRKHMSKWSPLLSSFSVVKIESLLYILYWKAYLTWNSNQCLIRKSVSKLIKKAAKNKTVGEGGFRHLIIPDQLGLGNFKSLLQQYGP